MKDAPEERRVAEVRAALARLYGPLAAFERFPCSFENRPFYDVARFEAGGTARIVKWAAPERSGSLRSEFDITSFLHARGFPTAAAERFDGTVALMVLEYLPGRDLRAEDLDAGRIQEIADILRRLHAVSSAEAPASTQRRISPSFVEEARAVFMKKAPLAEPLFPPGMWERITAAFDRLAARCTYAGVSGLCRRDLHHANWYLRTDGALSMLDLQNAIISDITNDLCELDVSLTRDPALLAAFRESYGPARYDRATDPVVRSLHVLEADVSRIVRMRRAHPQPEREQLLRARIDEAVRFAGA